VAHDAGLAADMLQVGECAWPARCRVILLVAPRMYRASARGNVIGCRLPGVAR
jgi:hypothetical protein